jgi:hypothetical protein
MEHYSEAIEQMMKKFFNTLSEKDKRHYAAVEAKKLGHGGISYIAEIMRCSRTTIHEGLAEMENIPSTSTYNARIRQEGGGRASYEENYPEINAAFLDILKDNTAGDPMDEKILWTNLTNGEIQSRLAGQHEIDVSEIVIRKLLKKHNFRRRKAQKKER